MTTSQAPPAPEPWDIDNDALAHALAWLTRHHGRERTPESLLAGTCCSTRIQAEKTSAVNLKLLLKLQKTKASAGRP